MAKRGSVPSPSLPDSLLTEITERAAELEAAIAPTVAEINRLRKAEARLSGRQATTGRGYNKLQYRPKVGASQRVLEVLRRSGSPMTAAQIGREIGNPTPHSLLYSMVGRGLLVKDAELKTYTPA